MAELLSQLDGVAFLARVAVDSPRHLMVAKKEIKQAFQYQVEGKGFSFVEVLSSCPTNRGSSPLATNALIQEELIPYYPLGVFRNDANL